MRVSPISMRAHSPMTTMLQDLNVFFGPMTLGMIHFVMKAEQLGRTYFSRLIYAAVFGEGSPFMFVPFCTDSVPVLKMR